MTSQPRQPRPSVMTPKLSVITDEIAAGLDDVLVFATAEQLAHLEVRQIDGTNFLLLEPPVLKAAAARIAASAAPSLPEPNRRKPRWLPAIVPTVTQPIAAASSA